MVYQVYQELQELLGEKAVMARKENPEKILEKPCTSGGEGQSVLM